MRADLVLLHAPSVYDFRKRTIMYGPMSDLVPSTPIFEMYPIGFLTMANYLKKKGIKVRIVNLAYRMLKDNEFDAEKFISRLDASAFGIDLHWLPHAQGSLEVARLVKKYHPGTPVIFGGFSASYFYQELINYDQVDYILRGDSTEIPLAMLMQAIKHNDGSSLERIPNLVYRQDKKVKANPLSCISTDLEEIDFDYTVMFDMALRYLDVKSLMPFSDWLRYPITTIPVVRGCNYNCSGCGGSATAFKDFAHRQKPAFRSPRRLVAEISEIGKYINAPVFILGDINQNGREYVEEFFGQAAGLPSGIQIFFEFFQPPENWFFDRAHSIFKNVLYEISPDTHDSSIRGAMGKPRFTNQQLMECIKYALGKGAVRFDLYFMTGLPGQDKQSVLDTVDFCQDIYQHLNWDPRFMPFISPMAPFMDPGSRAFAQPHKFGYSLTRTTLAQHVEAITQPSWKYILNYRSQAISNDDLVQSTYQAALGLNLLKGRAGSISSHVMEENERRIEKAMEVMGQIDAAMGMEDEEAREVCLDKLKQASDSYSMSTVCEKKELEFPLFNRGFNWFRIISKVLFKK